MPFSSIHALVLAAGKGTRMHSPQPKGLQTLLGEPMLWYVYEALKPHLGERIHTVVGHGAAEVRAVFPAMSSRFVLQERQLGTGHALQCSMPALGAAGAFRVLVVNGDTPLLSAARVGAFLAQALVADAPVVFASITPPDPGAFGRVLRDAGGGVAAIIEKKEYETALHGPDRGEVNAGMYLLDMTAVSPLLPRLSNANNSGEFYITDLVGLALAEGLRVAVVECGDAPELLGVNSPAELAAAEDFLAGRIARSWLAHGALVRNPGAARIGPRAVLAPGAEVCGPCELLGQTIIGPGARVESQAVLRDALVAEGAAVRAFSHLEGADVGPGCVVGPYARLRPGAVLKAGAKVGNFVEVKKAVLHEGAKASHLTYLGDAEVGAGANIGAGTITCNYDGVNKHRTVIGAGAFIGSNSALVAPVTVGDGSLIAAGSTITEDVPPGGLAIARARQVVKPRRR